jgi:O-antigen/teichoic acid export membrane protein
MAEILALLGILTIIFRREFYLPGILLVFKKLNASWYKEYLGLFLVSLSAVAFSSFERLIGVSKLGTEEIATLGFVSLFFSAAMMFQSTVNSIVFPYMTKIYLSHGKLILIKLSAALSLGGGVFLFFSFLFINIVFGELFNSSFEKYSVGYEIFLLMIITVVFKAFDFLSNVYLILKIENFITFTRTALVLLLSIFLYIYGVDLIYFVAASCVVNILYGLFLFLNLWKIYESN